LVRKVIKSMEHFFCEERLRKLSFLKKGRLRGDHIAAFQYETSL